MLVDLFFPPPPGATPKLKCSLACRKDGILCLWSFASVRKPFIFLGDISLYFKNHVLLLTFVIMFLWFIIIALIFPPICIVSMTEWILNHFLLVLWWQSVEICIVKSIKRSLEIHVWWPCVNVLGFFQSMYINSWNRLEWGQKTLGRGLTMLRIWN